jgi:LysM repeat protein
MGTFIFNRKIFLSLVAILAISFSSCSSMNSSESGTDDDMEFTEEAGTDEVPEGEASELSDSADVGDSYLADSDLGGEEDLGGDLGEDSDLVDSTLDEDDGFGDDTLVAVDSSSANAVPSYPEGSAVPTEGGEYTVREGDTLMKIAFEMYGSVYGWKKIYKANSSRISDSQNLKAGTVILLNKSGNSVAIDRNGAAYLIKSGDTLGTIAKDVYGTTKLWKALWQNNRQLVQNPDVIYAGFQLYYLPKDQIQMAPENKMAAVESREPASEMDSLELPE